MADCDGSTLTFETAWKTAPNHFSSPQYLSVDETKRSRASSDPGSLHICIVPEITITGDDDRNSDCTEDDKFDSFLNPPLPRPRANTCPEEMFRARKGRPPTPPPEDVHILRNPVGKRFSFNFSPKDVNGISFAHHRLGKVHEEKAEQQHKNSSIVPCESSVGAEISAFCSSPSVSQTNVHCHVRTDNALPRLNQCSTKAKCSANKSGDLCVGSNIKSLSVAACNNSEKSNNKEKLITNRETDTERITCSSGMRRSKEDGRDDLDSDHLIAY